MKPKIFKKEGNIVSAVDIGKKDDCTLVYCYKVDSNGELHLFNQYAIYPINKESRREIAEIKRMSRTYKE